MRSTYVKIRGTFQEYAKLQSRSLQDDYLSRGLIMRKNAAGNFGSIFLGGEKVNFFFPNRS